MRPRVTSQGIGIRPGAEAKRIESFIRSVVDGASAKGTVVALSGGIDSAVVGALCVRALGKARVTVLLMPSDHTPARDTSDARSPHEAGG